jgi:hypothetical protein
MGARIVFSPRRDGHYGLLGSIDAAPYTFFGMWVGLKVGLSMVMFGPFWQASRHDLLHELFAFVSVSCFHREFVYFNFCLVHSFITHAEFLYLWADGFSFSLLWNFCRL